MAFQIEWLPDEPILIVTASGLITAADFSSMYARVATMIDGRTGKIYRIADYTNADSSFMDVIKAVKAAGNSAGSSADPRLQTVYVGTSQWISFARTALQQPQFGGIMIPTFFELQEGIDYARRELAKAHISA